MFFFPQVYLTAVYAHITFILDQKKSVAKMISVKVMEDKICLTQLHAKIPEQSPLAKSSYYYFFTAPEQ